MGFSEVYGWNVMEFILRRTVFLAWAQLGAVEP